jgi:hypothetical protein
LNRIADGKYIWRKVDKKSSFLKDNESESILDDQTKQNKIEMITHMLAMQHQAGTITQQKINL